MKKILISLISVIRCQFCKLIGVLHGILRWRIYGTRISLNSFIGDKLLVLSITFIGVGVV